MSKPDANRSDDQSSNFQPPMSSDVSPASLQQHLPPPLVIVSQQGRHDQASRRIVRAQAARASAAQSRVTRARNREGRESNGNNGNVRGDHATRSSSSSSPSSIFVAEERTESKVSPRASTTCPQEVDHLRRAGAGGFSSFNAAPAGTGLIERQNIDQHGTYHQPFQSPYSHSYHQHQAQSQQQQQQQQQQQHAYSRQLQDQHQQPQQGARQQQPLVRWLIKLLDVSEDTLSTHSSATTPDAVESLIRSVDRGLRLPAALPRGYLGLQQRVDICPDTLALLRRTACIDLASPGLEGRLTKLLFDLIGISMISPTAPPKLKGHPIQEYLLIACTCLTIFQGQHTDSRAFAGDRAYHDGLEAAGLQAAQWSSAESLPDSKSAEAAIWAICIICVTTGISHMYFHDALRHLLHDLQLRSFAQVRRVLLDFIYPVSLVDELCTKFYMDLPPSVTRWESE